MPQPMCPSVFSQCRSAMVTQSPQVTDPAGAPTCSHETLTAQR